MPSVDDLAERLAAGGEGVPAGDFLLDTAVQPDAAVDGRFHAHLSDAWRVFYAFGGCTMAVALRAAHAAVDRPDLSPRLASAVFVSPVTCGPLVVDTEVLRAGKSAAQATAKLRNADAPDGTTAVHLTAVFGNDHESRVDFVDAEWPTDALPVDQAVEPTRPDDDDSPFANINYHQQTEFRIGMEGLDFADPTNWTPGPARSLTWHRLVKEPRLPDGTIDPVSYCAPADILGPAIFTKLGPIGPDNEPFMTLSLEITVQFLKATSSAWFLQHTRVPCASGGYAYAVVELWDEDRELVALATQRAHIRPVTMARFAQPDGTA